MKRQMTAIWLTISLLFPLSAIAGGVDNSIYKNLLDKHVKNGRVSYDGFKQDEALLDQYLAVLSAADPEHLTRNHRFAFYINAYNAFTIKLILSRYPDINSIKEIGSFFSGPWSKKFISLNGWTVSLDYIEHEVLRPKFKDPRIHFAINCAARSCPPLMGEPYEGEHIETQLDRQTRAFINNPRSTFVKDNTVFISKIFDWFEEDFNGNPLFFIRQYAGDRLKANLDTAGPEPKIKYLYYDWSLNRR
ncbi:MAG TPA: DUF547 domain-containing protein [Desulfobacteraceae bacterium]|nr:DUF547 domain-containing protein [Desulfobacteraceae bacterium]